MDGGSSDTSGGRVEVVVVLVEVAGTVLEVVVVVGSEVVGFGCVTLTGGREVVLLTVTGGVQFGFSGWTSHFHAPAEPMVKMLNSRVVTATRVRVRTARRISRAPCTTATGRRCRE